MATAPQESEAERLARLEAECDLDFTRAGGPGGQHRNKAETAVRLTHRPTGIVLVASEHRSQARNRKVALQRLAERLDEIERRRQLDRKRRQRKPRRSSRAAEKRRLDAKRRRGEKKRLRRRIHPDDGGR